MQIRAQQAEFMMYAAACAVQHDLAFCRKMRCWSCNAVAAATAAATPAGHVHALMRLLFDQLLPPTQSRFHLVLWPCPKRFHSHPACFTPD
jgi:hypothetical protein